MNTPLLVICLQHGEVRKMIINSMQTKHWQTMLSFIIFLFFFSTTTSAASFLNEDTSVSAMGQANAVVAQTLDASVMASNAASIAWLSPIELTAGFSQSSDSVRLNGVQRSQRRATSNLEHLYVTWMPHDSRFGGGIGYNHLYNLNRDWDNALFSGQANWTFLSVYHFNTDLVYAINSNMAIAAGIDGYLGELRLDSGTSQFSAKRQSSYGAHVGLRWKFTPHWNWGFSWRSATKMNFNGNSIGAVAGTSQVQFHLPDQIQTGIAWDILDTVRIETDAIWRGFAATNNLNIVGSTTENIPLKLRNTVNIMLGISWTWHENNQFRFGYTKAQGISSLANYNARLSDIDHNQFSLGMGMEVFDSHLDLAYTYSFYPQKTITNAPFTGTFKNNHSAFSFSWSKKL